MKITRLPVCVGLVAGMVFALACSGGALDHPQQTQAPEPDTAPAPTVAPVSNAATAPADAAAPPRAEERPDTERWAADFRFVLFQGGDVLGATEMTLSELEGRPVVLNFWARLCTPCWSEMPELQDFYEEYADRVRLLGIDVGQFTGLGSHKDAGKLLDSLGITYPAGYTGDAQVVRDYRIQAMPTTAFITAEGEVFRLWTGSITRDEVTAIVREMLATE